VRNDASRRMNSPVKPGAAAIAAWPEPPGIRKWLPSAAHCSPGKSGNPVAVA